MSFPSILVIVPRFCLFSLRVRITALPHSSTVFLSTRVCCSNYFKVIRALIAGRCFSGGQVPGGASPVTHSVPALCAVPPTLPHRLSLPGFACRPATLQHNWITAGVVLQFCRKCWVTYSDYWFTATPLLKTRLGPNGGRWGRRLLGLLMGRIEKLIKATLFWKR